MTSWFIDANVFLRFLTIDDRGQHEKAAGLFEKARRNQVLLVCGPPVLFELAWTLRAAYKTPRAKVIEILDAIYSMPGITLTDEPLVASALTLAAETGGEFADAYIAASARASVCSGVATFNRKDFARLGIGVAEL
jgi:predicted nucleic acid-binding protein